MRGLLAALYVSGLVPVQVPKHYFPSLQARLRLTEDVLIPTPRKTHWFASKIASDVFTTHLRDNSPSLAYWRAVPVGSTVRFLFQHTFIVADFLNYVQGI